MEHRTLKRRILYWIRMATWISGIGNLGNFRWFRRLYGGTWALVYVDICCCCEIWFEDFEAEAYRPHFEHLIEIECWS